MSVHGRSLGLAVGAVAAIAGGWLLSWAEAVAAGIGLSALAAADLALVRRPRGARWQELSVPRRAKRGDRAATVLSVEVDGDARWVSAVGAGDRRWIDHETLAWPIATSRRGAWPDGPTALEFADPLGLRGRVLATRATGTVLVVPRVRRLAPVVAVREAEGLMASSPGTDHFQSLREYVIGDPLRSVHWRTSGRLGTLAVRTMTDARAPGVLVALDAHARAYDRTGSQFADFDEEAFEEAVELAASACWANAAHGRRVILTSTAEGAPVLEVDAGTRARALDWLALVAPSASAAPARIAAQARHAQVSSVVLVTGRAGRPASLGLARGAADLTVMRAA